MQNKSNVINMLLQPEERLPRKNINIWLEELIKRAQSLNRQETLFFHKLHNICNISALVYSLMGQLERAEKLCVNHIIFFSKQSELNNQKFIIQPWINMARLDRIKGNFNEALAKFKQMRLLLDAPSNVRLKLYSVNKDNLIKAIVLDKQVEKVIRTCSFLEPIKINLFNQNYIEVLHLSHQLLTKKYENFYPVALEAMIIAYANLENYEKAHLAFLLAQKHAIQLTHIFMLRQAELYAEQEELTQSAEIFEKLYKFIEYLDEKNYVDINYTIFATKLASQLLEYGFEGLAQKTFERSLSLAKKLQDELLILECLASLVKISDSIEYHNLYEGLLLKSGYAQVKAKYSNHFQPVNNSHLLCQIEKSNLLMQILTNFLQ